MLTFSNQTGRHSLARTLKRLARVQWSCKCGCMQGSSTRTHMHAQKQISIRIDDLLLFWSGELELGRKQRELKLKRILGYIQMATIPFIFFRNKLRWKFWAESKYYECTCLKKWKAKQICNIHSFSHFQHTEYRSTQCRNVRKQLSHLIIYLLSIYTSGHQTCS